MYEHLSDFRETVKDKSIQLVYLPPGASRGAVDLRYCFNVIIMVHYYF